MTIVEPYKEWLGHSLEDMLVHLWRSDESTSLSCVESWVAHQLEMANENEARDLINELERELSPKQRPSQWKILAGLAKEFKVPLWKLKALLRQVEPYRVIEVLERI